MRLDQPPPAAPLHYDCALPTVLLLLQAAELASDLTSRRLPPLCTRIVPCQLCCCCCCRLLSWHPT
jgi:hypothetical protein